MRMLRPLIILAVVAWLLWFFCLAFASPRCWGATNRTPIEPAPRQAAAMPPLLEGIWHSRNEDGEICDWNFIQHGEAVLIQTGDGHWDIGIGRFDGGRFTFCLWYSASHVCVGQVELIDGELVGREGEDTWLDPHGQLRGQGRAVKLSRQ